MALTDYTTYDTIRAVLGVNAKELKDPTLALALWESQFTLEMGDVDQGGGKAMAQYTSIKAIAAGSRTTEQQSYFDIFNMLAAYSVARQLLSPQAMFAVQKVTDGRASIERFSASNFDKVRQGVEGTYSTLLKRLTAILIKLDPTATVPAATPRRYIGNVGLGTDPVTGT